MSLLTNQNIGKQRDIRSASPGPASHSGLAAPEGRLSIVRLLYSV